MEKSILNHKGFLRVMLIVVLLVIGGSVVSAAKYMAQFTPENPTTVDNTPNPNAVMPIIPTTTQPQSPQPPSQSEVLGVAELNANKEQYVGKRIKVKGRINVNVFNSEVACEDDTECDTTLGAQLELWEPVPKPGVSNWILLFSNNQPYSCQKVARETYSCPPYVHNQTATLEGVWTKDQVPVQWVGGSGAPKPVKWGDRFFLNIEN